MECTFNIFNFSIKYIGTILIKFEKNVMLKNILNTLSVGLSRDL